jgi:hypothetical protein
LSPTPSLCRPSERFKEYVKDGLADGDPDPRSVLSKLFSFTINLYLQYKGHSKRNGRLDGKDVCTAIIPHLHHKSHLSPTFASHINGLNLLFRRQAISASTFLIALSSLRQWLDTIALQLVI